MEHYDILIVGGGAAGIAAAKEAEGASVLLVDRRSALGGVLLQCVHPGFGKNQTGVEYAAELSAHIPENVTMALNTTVLEITEDRTALLRGRELGRKTVGFSQLILASGCREIPIGALTIGGTRPKGVYTAGQMQEMMNLYGCVPEGPAVILGSGDLGLVMAKQLAQKGIAVTLVEQKPHCGGMVRNRSCLREYPMKLICNATVAELRGEKQLESVILQNGASIPCKTLLVAVGLRPERELVSHLGNPGWLHICGNCNTVHPMVEGVIHEGKQAGIAAIKKLRGAV